MRAWIGVSICDLGGVPGSSTHLTHLDLRGAVGVNLCGIKEVAAYQIVRLLKDTRVEAMLTMVPGCLKAILDDAALLCATVLLNSQSN